MPWVYVPSSPVSPGDREAVLELRRTGDGRLALLAYSSLAMLLRCRGPHQPWVAVELDRIDTLPALTGADIILWDYDFRIDFTATEDLSG